MWRRKSARISSGRFNLKVGRLDLGTVDTALRSSLAVAKVLKAFGGAEQAPRPSDWRKGRRRDVDSGFNQRSDYKAQNSSASASTWYRQNWHQ